MGFEEFDLPEPLQMAIRDLGFTVPTPIQAEALPLVLEGVDVAAQAQTGTGKTACFLLAILKRLLEGEERTDGLPRAIIIAPTRELVLQISEDAKNLAMHSDVRITTCFGGMSWAGQAESLRAGTDIVVGTPGRLIDYLKNRILNLRSIESVVIDEADRMFDMGFVDDIHFLFRKIPPRDRRQAMLFSATLDHRVMRLSSRYMRETVKIEIMPDKPVVDLIEQELYHVGSHEKVSLMLGLFEREKPHRTVVFVNTKRLGEELAWRLSKNGWPSVYMSGDLPQKKRLSIIGAYKDGKIPTLVATDVASRGLHVNDVSHVFNYDLPEDPEDYIHRIGRTARAGASGKAISFACELFVYSLEATEKLIGHSIPVGFPDDALFLEDRAGFYKYMPGNPYVGWPPEGTGGGGGSSSSGNNQKRRRNRTRRASR